MQDIDNNMDDLFRKAAAGYPLKTDVSGWDKIADLLPDTTLVTAMPEKKGKRNHCSSLLILLFGFLLIGTSTILYNNYKKKAGKTIWKNNQVKADSQHKQLFVKNIKNEASSIINKETFLTSKQTSSLTVITNSAIHPTIVVSEKPGKHLLITKKKASVSSYHNEEILTLANGKSPNENTINEIPAAQNAPSQINTAPLKSSVLPGNKKADDQTDLITATDVIKTLPSDLQKMETSKKAVDSISKTNKRESVKNKKGSGKFYVGAIAGISFNQVKKQGFQKPGYNIGLLAGYQLSKRLSVETGLIFEQKYYYTKGEYFDMSKLVLTMPVGMKVISLNSSFAIFELPVNFKYNFNKHSTNGHLYATAGISTYLSSKEFNQYKTLLNGTGISMTGTYNNVSHYTAASLNISLGYQKNIGKYARANIEPYIQLPLKGIGVGTLPVTTAGIHLGLFRVTR